MQVDESSTFDLDYSSYQLNDEAFLWSTTGSLPNQPAHQQYRLLEGSNQDHTDAIKYGDAQQPVTISPYTSLGFVVWYCFLFLCCGIPIFCCIAVFSCRSYQRRLSRHRDDEMTEWAQQREEDIAREISRIEANVTAFSLKEQESRKALLKLGWSNYRKALSDDDFDGCHFGEVEEVKLGKDLCYETDGDIATRVRVPLPGRRSTEQSCDRFVSCHCAICLGMYQKGSSIVWSSNRDCPHVFHEECIAAWLMTRQSALCPCCRQPFTSNGSSDGFSKGEKNHENVQALVSDDGSSHTSQGEESHHSPDAENDSENVEDLTSGDNLSESLGGEEGNRSPGAENGSENMEDLSNGDSSSQMLEEGEVSNCSPDVENVDERTNNNSSPPIFEGESNQSHVVNDDNGDSLKEDEL
eukprot:CAMPEP_0197452328 /NCGR_PEP_ID=MMETSP1175-20131217/31782_1 /TAXON_ID=1003142 /ORGANISM="Triceratium dubium, Strain CCMP147" /LENGTH=410 /DNA_ID=CAMNT_0042985309 /DNA_START=361 /DNA_END=1593 /DNA_ORIENTATION=-